MAVRAVTEESKNAVNGSQYPYKRLIKLTNKYMDFFTKTVVDETKVKTLEVKLEKMEKEKTDMAHDQVREINQLKADFASQKKIYEAEYVVKLNEATQAKVEENNKIKQENAVLLEKVNILEKAFENMGFDVKDMKEILNKLVDGIVDKNKINVISTK